MITTVLSDFEENFNEPILQGEVILKEGEEETLLRTYIYDYYTWTTSGKLSCKWISETEVLISGYIIYDYQLKKITEFLEYDPINASISPLDKWEDSLNEMFSCLDYSYNKNIEACAFQNLANDKVAIRVNFKNTNEYFYIEVESNNTNFENAGSVWWVDDETVGFSIESKTNEVRQIDVYYYKYKENQISLIES